MLGSGATTESTCDVGTVFNEEKNGCVACETLPPCPNGNARYPMGCICLEDGMDGAVAPRGSEGDKPEDSDKPDGGDKTDVDEGEGKTTDADKTKAADSAIEMSAIAALGSLSTALLF